MKLKFRKNIFSFIFLFLVLLTDYSYGWRESVYNNDDIPGPQLLYPISDNIVLKNSASMEFKWRRTDFANTDYYIFKIYKGHKMLSSTLVLKKKIPLETYPVQIPIAFFEKNQVYTWSLIQVFKGGKKSDRSYSAFKIIKKEKN